MNTKTDEKQTMVRDSADGNSKHGSDCEWQVARSPCRGPCWNGYWTVAREVQPGVWQHVRNDAGKTKRFRSDEAAQQEAARRNGAAPTRPAAPSASGKQLHRYQQQFTNLE